MPDPLSRRRPLSSTGPARWKRFLSSLNTAGPFDAVTNIRAELKTVKWRQPTSSSGALLSLRLFLPQPSSSSFASSPYCPPGHE